MRVGPDISWGIKAANWLWLGTANRPHRSWRPSLNRRMKLGVDYTGRRLRWLDFKLVGCPQVVRVVPRTGRSRAGLAHFAQAVICKHGSCSQSLSCHRAGKYVGCLGLPIHPRVQVSRSNLPYPCGCQFRASPACRQWRAASPQRALGLQWIERPSSSEGHNQDGPQFLKTELEQTVTWPTLQASSWSEWLQQRHEQP